MPSRTMRGGPGSPSFLPHHGMGIAGLSSLGALSVRSTRVFSLFFLGKRITRVAHLTAHRCLVLNMMRPCWYRYAVAGITRRVRHESGGAYAKSHITRQ